MQTPSLTRSLWFHLPRRQQPALLTLLVLWFACIFAPIVCILHCSMLGIAPGQQAAGHTHAHHRGSTATSHAGHTAACHVIDAQPAQSPELPPMATLPRVLNDVLLATVAPFLLLTRARATRESATPRLPVHFPRPHTPPPKLTPVARAT